MAACDDAVFGAIIGDFVADGTPLRPLVACRAQFLWQFNFKLVCRLTHPSTVAHVSQAVRARHMTVGAFAFHIMTAKRTLQIGTV